MLVNYVILYIIIRYQYLLTHMEYINYTLLESTIKKKTILPHKGRDGLFTSIMMQLYKHKITCYHLFLFEHPIDVNTSV